MPQALSTRRSVAAGVQRRVATATTYDSVARTVELVLATDTPILMPGWKIGIDQRTYYEILDCTPGACDLSQVAAGNAPLLDTHGRWSLADRLGVLNSARFENGQLIVVAGFGQSEAARTLEAEVAAGTAPPASAGYAIQQLVLERFEGDIPVYRATKWSLREGSFTPIAADPNAGVRSDNGLHPCEIEETRAMPQPTPAGTPASQTREQLLASVSDEGVRAAIAAQWQAPTEVVNPAPAQQQERQADPAPAPGVVADQVLTRADALQYSEQARSLGVDNEQIRTLLAAPTTTPAAAGAAILAAAAARQSGETNRVPYGSAGRAHGGERDSVREGVRGAIEHGLRGTSRVDDVPEVARQFMRLSLSEMAATVLGEREMPRSAADRIGVFERAFHTTSDFPSLLSGALNTRLEENYAVAEPVYRQIARQMSFMDFRAHDVLRPGDFPTLQKVNEAGEIKFGTFGEKKETAYVVPYGIQFGLSRQLLVNDHLGAIDQVLNNQGMAVALFEEITFFDMKAQNAGLGPTLVEDGKTVFHADHGNLAAPGTVIDTTNLGKLRAAQRKQKNLSGKQMGYAPKTLLVTPDKETEGEMALAQVVVNDVAKANPFSGKLDLVVGGQLAGNAWELYVDRVFGTNWVWGLLDGFTAPRLKIEDVFGQQGVKVSLEHDFGCGATDFRYGQRNPGA
jgi:hypothetical protein